MSSRRWGVLRLGQATDARRMRPVGQCATNPDGPRGRATTSPAGRTPQDVRARSRRLAPPAARVMRCPAWPAEMTILRPYPRRVPASGHAFRFGRGIVLGDIARVPRGRSALDLLGPAGPPGSGHPRRRGSGGRARPRAPSGCRGDFSAFRWPREDVHAAAVTRGRGTALSCGQRRSRGEQGAHRLGSAGGGPAQQRLSQWARW